MCLIKVDNISYEYKKSVPVLTQFSAEFDKGKVYAILGASGSGKTTLLSLLAGLDICKQGDIYYQGAGLKNISCDKYRAYNVGMIFQQFNLLHRFNALENVLIGMEISDYKIENRISYAESLLEDFGITKEKRHRKVIELSGGEQQRVAIARAISHQPDIILADEPTGSLDETNQKYIIEKLVSLARADDKCVILSTHSKDVAGYADCVIRL